MKPEKSISEDQPVTTPAKLDPTSDRYRVCPHPHCGKAHMAMNRGKDYCCNQHADDHYNMLRRLKKQAQQAEAARLLVKEQPQLFNERPTQQVSAPAAEIIREIPIELERNYRILSQLTLDPIAGTVFTLEDLDKMSLDLRYYSALKRNYNVPKDLPCNWMAIGPFRIYRVETEKFLIIKK